jgi:hypothetical protein
MHAATPSAGGCSRCSPPCGKVGGGACRLSARAEAEQRPLTERRILRGGHPAKGGVLRAVAGSNVLVARPLKGRQGGCRGGRA